MGVHRLPPGCFKIFSKNWEIHLRISSAGNTKSSERAELALIPPDVLQVIVIQAMVNLITAKLNVHSSSVEIH